MLFARITRGTFVLISCILALTAPADHALAKQVSSEPDAIASGSVAATFVHSAQDGSYRSHLSASGSLLFAEADSEQAIFALQPAAGIISWESNAEESAMVGPLPILIAKPISDQDVNVWIEDPEKSGIITSPPPISLSQIEILASNYGDAKVWTNQEKFAARVFFRDCIDGTYHRHGNILFEPGTIEVKTWFDQTGDLQAKIAADGVAFETDGTTWSHIRLDCEVEALPEKPSEGVSEEFAGSYVHVPLDPNTLGGDFESIVRYIRTLMFQDAITVKEAEKLFDDLNKASEFALRTETVGLVEKALGKFRDGVERLLQDGTIDPVDADELNFRVDEFQATSLFVANQALPFPNPANYCLDPGGICPVEEICKPTTFYVDAESEIAKPDGTVERPFRTIVQALVRANDSAVCRLNLVVAPGAYIGDLVVTRPTSIVGTDVDPDGNVIIRGSIVNTGPYRLAIENAIISPIGTGVLVENPCARTILTDVVIEGAEGYGIRHQGGSLLADNLTINRTLAVTDELSEGTGILMTCGARGAFREVDLHGNESSALLLSDPGTEVSAFDLSVSGTRVHPLLTPPPASVLPWGAIHVRDNANLVVSGFDVRRNSYFGVWVESEAQAIFRGSASVVMVPDGSLRPGFDCADALDFGSTVACLCGIGDGCPPLVPSYVIGPNSNISDTITSDPYFESGEEKREGGLNAAAFRDGSLILTNFESTDAFAGITVASNGQADLHIGEVRECGIGAAVGVPGYDISRLARRVHYTDNDTDLQSAGGLPIPDPGPGLPPP